MSTDTSSTAPAETDPDGFTPIPHDDEESLGEQIGDALMAIPAAMLAVLNGGVITGATAYATGGMVGLGGTAAVVTAGGGTVYAAHKAHLAEAKRRQDGTSGPPVVKVPKQARPRRAATARPARRTSPAASGRAAGLLPTMAGKGRAGQATSGRRATGSGMGARPAGRGTGLGAGRTGGGRAGTGSSRSGRAGAGRGSGAAGRSLGLPSTGRHGAGKTSSGRATKAGTGGRASGHRAGTPGTGTGGIRRAAAGAGRAALGAGRRAGATAAGRIGRGTHAVAGTRAGRAAAAGGRRAAGLGRGAGSAVRRAHTAGRAAIGGAAATRRHGPVAAARGARAAIRAERARQDRVAGRGRPSRLVRVRRATTDAGLSVGAAGATVLASGAGWFGGWFAWAVKAFAARVTGAPIPAPPNRAPVAAAGGHPPVTNIVIEGPSHIRATTPGATMSQSATLGLLLTELSGQMAAAATGYDPDGMDQWGTDVQAIAGVLENVAGMMRAIEKGADGEPIEPAVTGAISTVASLLEAAASAAGEIHSTFETVHKDDLDRIRNPRANEHKWDIGANK